MIRVCGGRKRMLLILNNHKVVLLRFIPDELEIAVALNRGKEVVGLEGSLSTGRTTKEKTSYISLITRRISSSR